MLHKPLTAKNRRAYISLLLETKNVVLSNPLGNFPWKIIAERIFSEYIVITRSQTFGESETPAKKLVS